MAHEIPMKSLQTSSNSKSCKEEEIKNFEFLGNRDDGLTHNWRLGIPSNSKTFKLGPI